MGRKRNSMPFYGHNWRTGTEDMPSEWRGPYLDLIWIIYSEGGRVPNIETSLARHARLGTRKFKRFWAAVSHKFIIDGDEIGHRKIDETLAKFRESSAKLLQKTSKPPKKPDAKQGPDVPPWTHCKTRGFTSPLQGKSKTVKPDSEENQNPESQSDASAPARESGGSLSPDIGAALINEIKIQAGQRVSIREWDAFRQHVIAEGHRSLTVTPEYWTDLASPCLIEQAEQAGITIEPQSAEIIPINQLKAGA